MLKDADHSYFSGVYIVCGYTDLRFGIDSLAAIIERRFHMHLFVPNTLFLFCGRSSTKIKGLLWEGDGFLLYKRVESGPFTIDRKNFIIIESSNGAKASAILYSLVETAKANMINTFEYFNLLLTEIPQHMDDKDLRFIEDLLPWSPRVQKECPSRYKKS